MVLHVCTFIILRYLIPHHFFLVGERPIYNLEGSIFKWVNENRPIIDSDGAPTQFVHPYNAFFGKLLDPSHRYSPKT